MWSGYSPLTLIFFFYCRVATAVVSPAVRGELIRFSIEPYLLILSALPSKVPRTQVRSYRQKKRRVLCIGKKENLRRGRLCTHMREHWKTLSTLQQQWEGREIATAPPLHSWSLHRISLLSFWRLRFFITKYLREARIKFLFPTTEKNAAHLQEGRNKKKHIEWDEAYSETPGWVPDPFKILALLSFPRGEISK